MSLMALITSDCGEISKAIYDYYYKGNSDEKLEAALTGLKQMKSPMDELAGLLSLIKK